VDRVCGLRFVYHTHAESTLGLPPFVGRSLIVEGNLLAELRGYLLSAFSQQKIRFFLLPHYQQLWSQVATVAKVLNT